MSQGDFGDNADVDDAFLEELINTDIDVRGDNEADEAPAAAAACTLPVLGNIWECHITGEILRAYNRRITVEHGAEHVVSLCFSDVYTKVPEFKQLSNFAKKVCNIFGSVRHSPSAMFKKYSRAHNKGVYIGFIKPSECRMAGEHIALLRLLRGGSWGA